MGKKRLNAKARQNDEVTVDNTQTKKIKIEIDCDGYSGYDDANALVLPSTKRETKITAKGQQVTRILNKKQRKRLEQIVDRKKKRENRTALLQNLASVQITTEELRQYTSISTAQTIGIKGLNKISRSDGLGKNDQIRDCKSKPRVSSISGVNKKRRLVVKNSDNDEDTSDDNKNANQHMDPNIVGLKDESSDDDATSSDECNRDETNIEKNKSSNITGETSTETSSSTRDTKPKTKETFPSKPAVYVHLDRTPEIQAMRYSLPILAEEQQIMETISDNPVTIIAGETGSGKTTQLPQFLFEAGYAQNKLIGITEPRRVAAISMSKRVADEMNLTSREVSYLIRFEGNVTEDTRIKFMTDGVLLKEIENDFLLSHYSVIILDEAHERSVYTDILVGLLSRIVPLRNKKGKPLKLIIMSATLRVEDFISNRTLFKTPPPVLKIDSRQYPVTIHFQKHTKDDYLKEALRKTVKIHSKLPEGGILIFLTGQQEVNYLVRKLRKIFPYKSGLSADENHIPIDGNKNDEKFDVKSVPKTKKKLLPLTTLPNVNLDNYKLPHEDMEVESLNSDDDTQKDTDQDSEGDNSLSAIDIGKTKQPLWVLPLYSLLSTENQTRVFDPVPNGCRLCVVSTNVAETSLTIPNIKYVVDCGRQKTRLYDKITGVSAYVVTFTSKASADQRAGRAGRLSAGHCYRLYSSAVFNDEFAPYALPDIQKKPVDDLVLQMKCMGIDKVINFPFPSPPDIVQLKSAEKHLKLLGALEECRTACNQSNISKVTPLGHAIASFPVSPRFGKMLALSHQQDLLPYTVCLVAALSVQEVLLEVSTDNECKANRSNRSKWTNKRKKWSGTGNYRLLGDPMVLLRAVGAAEYAGSQGHLVQFCEENGLRNKAITEIRKLRVQLTNEINLNIPDVNLAVDPNMQPPNDLQAKFLRQIILSGMGDRVARRIQPNTLKNVEEKRKLKFAYQCIEIEEPIHMHSSCVLKSLLPEWVVYQEIYQLENGDTHKMIMRGITAIEPEWLLLYSASLCNIKAMKEDPPPRYNQEDGKVYCHVDASYGRCGWELPLSEIEMPLNAQSCKYFGLFFLNGDVFPELIQYKNKLRSSPQSILKPWSNLNPYLARFIKAIQNRYLNSRQKLLDLWKKEPSYLLKEYADMLHQVDCSQLASIWPPLQKIGTE